MRAKDREEELKAVFAAQQKAGASKKSYITDDEELDALVSAWQQGEISNKASAVDPSLKLSEVLKPGDEEYWQKKDALEQRLFKGILKVPEKIKDLDVRVVDDQLDAFLQTDVELSEEPFSDAEDPAIAAKWSKRRGRDWMRGEAERLVGGAGSGRAAAMLEEIEGLGRGAEAAAAAKRKGKAAGAADSDSDAADAFIGSPLGTGRDGKPRAMDDIRSLLSSDSSDSEAEAAAAAAAVAQKQQQQGKQSRKAGSRTGGGADALVSGMLGASTGSSSSSSSSEGEGGDAKRAGSAPSSSSSSSLPGPDDLSDLDMVVDSSDEQGAGFMQRPPFPKASGSRRSLFLPSYRTQAQEDDALLEEQAKQILEAGAAKGKQAASSTGSQLQQAADAWSLSGDDSSDWGGDPYDVRFGQSPYSMMRDWKAQHGLGDTDTEEEELLARGVDDETGTRINGVYGDRVETIPAQILRELAQEKDLQTHSIGSLYPKARTVREEAMTPEERLLDEQRKRLKDMIEKPLPIVSRPIWPTYAMIAAVDQVHQVVSGGMIQSTRCMIIVGNGQGGAGYGIGKHKEPFMATKMALADAHRDMIHVSTHKGQLYHDLIGKKNSTYVIIRTMPSSTGFLNAPPLITDTFEMMGIKSASAKTVGSKRRNPYTVVQALFDAFNHHYPPEEEAANRGLRMQWMGADRHNPRNVYPFSPSGPRYASASERHIGGRFRA